MNYLILIFKGFLIGIGKVIPGVSGAVIAIILNVYEKGIATISNIFKNLKENIKFLIPIGIGILIGIIIFSRLIVYLLNYYYLPTMLLFIGLIIGGIKSIKKEICLKRNMHIFVISILFLFVISKLNIVTKNEYNFIFTMIIGFIEAITMIVPGISGTAILMSLGCYNMIMESFISLNLSILFPFSIGVIIGIIIITKIINFLFIHYKEKTYVVICVFSLSSIISMFAMTFRNNYSLKEIVLGLLLLLLGYNVSKRIEKQ